MTWQVLMDAVANLEKNDAPRPYSCVLHPQQVWGTYGLSQEFSNMGTPTFSGTGSFTGMGDMTSQAFSNSLVVSIAGINIYNSSAVPDGATGRKRGGMFARTALGCGYIDFGGGNFIQMASEREEAYAKTTLVANGYWEIKELVDLHGVEIDTEIS